MPVQSNRHFSIAPTDSDQRQNSASWPAVEKKLKIRTAEAKLRALLPLKLAFWPENRRAIANELARSALFHCRDNRKPRIHFDNAHMFMLGEGALTYKGEELRTRDEEIFLGLAHCARDSPSGKMTVKLSSSDICKMNGWRQDQRYYSEIFLSIQRMKGGVITVFSRRLAKTMKCQRALEAGASSEELVRLHDELEAFDNSARAAHPLTQPGEEVAGLMVSLIGGDPTFTGATLVEDGIPMGSLSWDITLDKNLVSLFARPYLTMLDFKARQSLSGTGKRLQAYFMSHMFPYPVKLRSLEKMLGLNYAQLAALKFNMTKHLQELKDHRVIAEYDFKRSADGADWLVIVTRNPIHTESLNSK